MDITWSVTKEEASYILIGLGKLALEVKPSIVRNNLMHRLETEAKLQVTPKEEVEDT